MPHASNQPSLQVDACQSQKVSSPEYTAVQSYNATDPIPNAFPPSSPPSDSSEAFNTASARIHFGPFRSPEKQIIPVLNHGTGLHTPLRRSPRRSVANTGLHLNYSHSPNSQPRNDATEQEQATPLRMGTPIDDFAVEDEPSSVLANRISRAHDNPSPPPDPIPSLPLGIPIIDTISRSSSPNPHPDSPNSGSNSPGTLSPPSELLQRSTPKAPTPVSDDERDVLEILSVPDSSLNEITPLAPPSTPQKPYTDPETNSITPRRSTRITSRDETPKPSDKGKAKAERDENHPTSPLVGLIANQPPVGSGIVETPEQPSGTKEFCRELGSLSPGSSNLLTQLIPSSSKKSPQPPFSFSVFPSNPVPSGTTTRAPLRSSSPRRSPSKPQLQLSTHSDIPQTPARRVPIFPSTLHGQSSPGKRLPGLFTAKPPRTPILTMGPTSSPARRVAITDGGLAPLDARLGSAKRSPVKERAGSLEPRFKNPPNIKRQERCRSAEPASVYRFVTNKPSPLPYPLQPIAEERSGPSSSKTETLRIAPKFMGSLGSSPMKSNLRQPSSKIPRMDLGPYARRPNTKTAGRKEPQLTQALDLIKPIENRKTTQTLRTERFPLNSKSASGAGRQVTSTPYLKRKRELDIAPPVSILSDMDAVKQIGQQVVPPQPLANQMVLGQYANDDPAPTPEPPQHASTETEDNIIVNASSPPAPRDSSPILPDPDVATDPPPIFGNGSPRRSGIRRTTRTRRIDQATPSVDVFGATKTLPPARHKNTIQSEGLVLGMSAVALKALTNTNTVRNQKYLAANLQTEIIRKEGPRPDSPTTKVRTVLQRHQEDKKQQRKARAARRARRSDDGSEGHSDVDQHGEFERAESPDIPWEEGANKAYQSHRIGPGDEEEYETPGDHNRDPKRRKLEEGSPVKESRRVKWDRGLFTTIYLDQMKLGARPKPANIDVAKGCLAPTAKIVHLDTLGNLPDATVPLAELVQENVVVKKFVYDNDVEPAPAITKVTRSRNKKEKS